MRYTLENGKTVVIPDKEIESNMKALDISREDAIEMWLDDNDYTTNEEQENLDKMAKNVKIDVGCDQKSRKKATKPREKKVSDEKKAVFDSIFAFLSENYGENATILNENKLIQLKIADKTFKIDLIQVRNK